MDAPGAPSDPLQLIARLLLPALLIAAGLWVLHEFLAALAWAGILAIALWPLYWRLVRMLPARCEREVVPLLLVAGVALVFIGPLVAAGFIVAGESHVVVEFINNARHHGIAMPDWVAHLPVGGGALAEWWRDHLGDPATVQEWLGQMNPRALAESARQYGAEIAHRLILFGFTLLTLFFLFREGTSLAAQLRELSDRLIGQRGERIARQVIGAVHGTVSGLVLVGLAEGVVLGIVYFAVGLPYPASIGALTGIAAVIPFAAPVVYGLAGLYLLATGMTLAAIIVFVAGSVVVFVADHFVRPVLIGGAARLPFLWVLLGILGGIEALGFLGLFLGPAIMAALVALWREWTDGAPPAAARPPVPARRRAGARRGGGR